MDKRRVAIKLQPFLSRRVPRTSRSLTRACLFYLSPNTFKVNQHLVSYIETFHLSNHELGFCKYFQLCSTEIIKCSGDQNIKLVVVDYESSDVDIHRLIKKSSIKNYAIVTLSKKKEFRRAEALQKGAEVVTDPHSILFLCDLHLKIPATLTDIIRKVIIGAEPFVLII